MGTTMSRFSGIIAATVAVLGALAFDAPVRAQSVSADALIKAKTNCLPSCCDSGFPFSACAPSRLSRLCPC